VRLWVVMPVGVGEHPPIAITRTLTQAEEAAKAWWAKSDGYHTLDIRPYETNVLYETASRGIGSYMSRQPTTQPPHIDMESEYPRFEP
jgi:hypothetical protein